jgi:hypothetical protein
MTPDGRPEKLHLRADAFHSSQRYASPKGGPRLADVPAKPRAEHGAELIEEVATVRRAHEELLHSWEGREEIRARGIIVEFESPPGVELVLEQLIDSDSGFELLNRREEELPVGTTVTRETWYVPEGRLDELDKIFRDYLSREWPQTGEPLRRKLVDSIEKLQRAAVQQLWTETESMPLTSLAWFEVWLRAGKSNEERGEILQQYRQCAEQAGLRVGENRIELPEHTVLVTYGRGEAFSRDLALLNCIAEIRLGRDYADFFDNLRADEQMEFATNLAATVQTLANPSVALCVLDTGINRAHPLIEKSVSDADNLTIRADWAAADDDNHGTPMAGIGLFGEDLPMLLANPARGITFPYVMEGVKIVAPPGQRPDDEKIAGAYTAQGVAVVEANAPERRRVCSIATSLEGVTDGRPSSWSAELDALAFGRDNGGVLRRLFCISAGNVPQQNWPDYPTANELAPIQNPGQSWNCLCAGSYTKLVDVAPQNDGYRPIARPGRIAPTSRTSVLWKAEWPHKPDVVLEGGNAGFEAATNSALTLSELSLLSTHADFPNGPFCAIAGTSPAAGLAARMAAQLMSAYPDLWPETIRGLIIHSARWTQQMRQACPADLSPKRKITFLRRTVGHGVPDLPYAIESADHRATLIAQATIQPFRFEGEDVVFNEMHLHNLPWPIDILDRFYDERIKMRVTLSYFVEPNPGNRGYTSIFRYAGCGLRFRVCSAGQPVRHLLAQWNKIVKEELKRSQPDVEIVPTSTDGWEIGGAASRGSIQADSWNGTCADLMSMSHIAILPITGWWRTRPTQGRVEAKQNYSLIVTLETENPEIDIYSEIAARIAAPVTVEV